MPATRAAAEHVLSSFRQIPKVLPISQYILGKWSFQIDNSIPLTRCSRLDHTQIPMAQFQVAVAIGEVAVRDYTLYALSDLVQLKNHMVDYCMKRPEQVITYA